MTNDTATYSVLGAARSGLAVARLLAGEGAVVFVSDSRPADQCADAVARLAGMGVESEFGGHTDRVLASSVLVLSPGVPDTIPIVRRAREAGIRITNEIEVAASRCPAPIVAITGTNGKTTTTELAGHIFRSAGRPTFVAGNVGTAFSEIVPQITPDAVVVLEVSSFQLEHVETFRPAVAVVLNITPDHLDRYANFEAYCQAKYRIAMNQGPDDALVVNADDPYAAAAIGYTAARPFGISIADDAMPLGHGAFRRGADLVIDTGAATRPERVLPTDEIRIRGPHNLYNAMAASVAARLLGVEVPVIADALRSFPGVPHRLEPVRELDGVRWVNDSKATNVDSLRYALASFAEPIVLIAGGRSKKNVYDAVLPLVAANVKAAVVVGEAADEMEQAFAPLTRVLRAGFSMESAVALARSVADPGDVVLLSPACASFDMFQNYEHRGDVFKHLVGALEPNVPREDGTHVAAS